MKSFFTRFFFAGVLFFLTIGSLQVVNANGLPCEFLLSSRWRALSGNYSPLTNPALLTQTNYPTVLGVFSNTFGLFSMCELSGTYPVGLYQTAGVTVLADWTGAYNETGVDYNETGRSIPDNSIYTMLSYAAQVWGPLSIGVNVDLAYQNRLRDVGFGFGLDAGLAYNLIRNPFIGTHTLWFDAQHLLQPVLGMEKYPSVLRAGLSSDYLEHTLESSFDYALKDVFTSSSEFEIGKKMEWEFNARFGGALFRVMKMNGLMGLSQTGLSYWGVTAGMDVPAINMGRGLSAEYQYTFVPDSAGSLNNGVVTHSLYLRAEIGKHREMMYARKMATLFNMEPSLLFEKALQLHYAGQYWDSFFLFGRVRSQYPDFFKNDWAAYYMASCQEKMGMVGSARAAFQDVVKNSSRSVVVPYSQLGLLRVSYHENNPTGMESAYEQFVQTNQSDSLNHESSYYMAEGYVRQNQESDAIALLQSIPNDHPDYLYAQYTLAVLYSKQDLLDSAVSCLEQCVSITPTTDLKKEMVNLAYTLLGYSFYEQADAIQSAFPRAVSALRQVSKDSRYFEFAQIGLGWCALKARQWKDCMDLGMQLIKSSNPLVSGEGALLTSYAYIRQNDCKNAAGLLENGVKTVDSYQGLTENTISTYVAELKRLQTAYDSVGLELSKVALLHQATVADRVDNLGKSQRELSKEIKKRQTEIDIFDLSHRFLRGKDGLKEDLQYALAISQKMGCSKGAIKEKEEMQNKQKAIDQELEKLKKELNQK